MKTPNFMFLHDCVQAIPASIGVSATKGYHVNSLAVPRKAKEAIGGITKLTHIDGMQDHSSKHSWNAYALS